MPLSRNEIEERAAASLFDLYRQTTSLLPASPAKRRTKR